jgi:hypothetical protein
MPVPSFLQRFDRPRSDAGPVLTITANRRLKASENGAAVHFNSATSLIAVLPAPRKGLYFTFFVKTPAGSGLGHFIDLAGTVEKLFVKGFTAAAGKGAVNTQATGAVGDAFTVWSDGTDWFGIAEAGTFAREA